MAADKTEVRGLMRVDLAEFLDVAAMARNMDRNNLINKICLQWAELEAHRSNVLQRAAKNNPLLSDASAPTSNWGEMT
jgi:hypothetical protein